jgi:hypothetical protein
MGGTDNIADIVAYTIKGRMSEAASWYRVPNVLKPGEAITFAARGNSGAFKGDGWARPEAWGSRIAGSKADLMLNIRKSDYALHVLARSTAPEGKKVEARVIVNGQAIGQIMLDAPNAERDYIFDVARDLFSRQEELDVTFEILQPPLASKQQSALGISQMTLSEKPTGSRVDALPN